MTAAIEARHRYSMDDGNGDTKAHAEVHDRDGVLWLTNLWVHPDWRQKGYGGALMDRAVREWQGRDLYLAVQPYTDQPLAASQLRSLYADYGFVETDVPGVMRRPSAPWPPVAVQYPRSNAEPEGPAMSDAATRSPV